MKIRFIQLLVLGGLIFKPDHAFSAEITGTESAGKPAGQETPAAEEDGSRSWLDPVFGRYHVQLNFHGKPQFDENLKYYDDLYGKSGRYGMLGADYTPWGWFVNLGLGVRGGIYTDRGHAAKERPQNGRAVIDENGSTSLTLIPFQFVGVARMTPFPAKWLVVEAWFGRERAYFQEIRNVSSGSAALRSGRDSGIVGDSALTNKGWLSGTVTGVGGSLLLNPLDEKSVRSMSRSLGIGFVYLTVFKEQVTYLDEDRVSFGRSTTGVGFSFETVK